MVPRSCDIGFSLCPGIGTKKYHNLRTRFGSITKAWNADEASLLPLLGPSVTKTFLVFRNTFSLEVFLENLIKKQIEVVTYSEDDYPSLLKQIDSAPPVLYCLGNKRLLRGGENCIAIVGTRKVTDYGHQVTENITRELVAQNFIIVSGMAMGVDAIAHSVAVKKNGKTIAVLGNGVDICHPEVNRAIYQNIIAGNGLILSEYKPGTPPAVGTFPSRNRIIAGLSIGVVVTEGAEASGSLITAEYASSFNRTVYAIPGPINSSYSAGPNKLLKKGAIMVTNTKDILDVLGLKPISVNKKEYIGETNEERIVITSLQQGSLSFDELIKLTKLDPGSIAKTLSFLEMKHVIRHLEGNYTLNT